METTWRYKAFISYRHQPFDRKVAVSLQKHLETFKPPKSLEKNEKWRVFRDETELPTSADLSQDIREALENSEYLIVICSSMLAQSKWCREEISYFKSLHNHSTKKILALLIEGNPDEVFPEELCWSEEIRKSLNGEYIREVVQVEPLAANITASTERQSLKKLKTEFLRIAAPLIGCRYDDLYQREQKRKIRKSLAIMGGVTVVVGGIGIYSAVMAFRLNEQKRLLQEENYNRMAVESDYMWKDGKSMEAIETAVDSIPKTEDEMSVYSAEKATVEKLGAFFRESFLPVKEYETTSYIKNVAFVNKNQNIVAQDATGVYLWEVSSGKLIRKYTPAEFDIDEDSSYGIQFFVPKKKALESISVEITKKDGNMLSDGELTSEMMLYGYEKSSSKGDAKHSYFYLTDSNSIWKVDSKSGEYEQLEEVSEEEKIWHYSDTYTYSYYMKDGKIFRDYEEYEESKEVPGIWNGNRKCTLVVWDEDNIEEKKEYQYTAKELLDDFPIYVASISDKICYVYSRDYDDENGISSDYKLRAYQVKDGVILREEKPLLEEEIPSEEENTATIAQEEDYLIVKTTPGLEGDYTKYRIYDYDTGKKLSETIVSANDTYDDKFAGVLKKENTGNYTDILFTIMGKEIALVDINTGAIIYEYTFPSMILNVDYTKTGWILVILKNGKEYLIPAYNIEEEKKEKSVGAVLHEFESDIDATAWYKNDYLAVRGNRIYQYENVKNEFCESISEEDSLIYQTQDKNVKYPDNTKSKTMKPIIETLQEKNLVSSILWSSKIEDSIYMFGKDGVLYKVGKNRNNIESQITLKEEKEEEIKETSDDVTVWQTQNPDEILFQFKNQAWLVDLQKMEVRYEIEDRDKEWFAGYSKEKNRVLMENWLEDVYWTCPLYTAEELKELGTKWKQQEE